MTEELFYAVLAMDAFNRGYNPGLDLENNPLRSPAMETMKEGGIAIDGWVRWYPGRGRSMGLSGVGGLRNAAISFLRHDKRVSAGAPMRPQSGLASCSSQDTESRHSVVASASRQSAAKLGSYESRP